MSINYHRKVYICFLSSRGATAPRPLRESVINKPANEKEGVALGEVEIAAASAGHAMQRWIMSCTRAAGQDRLALVDVLVLHYLAHRPGPERLADLRFALDIEDTHVVAYSVRKLCSRGLITARRVGKDKTYSPSQLGREHVQRFEEVRTQRLLAQLQSIEPDRLQELGRYFKTMSGLYDQAARAASSL